MALPDRLKSARMTDGTVGRNIDDEVGNLEAALAAILGLSLDVDVTYPVGAHRLIAVSDAEASTTAAVITALKTISGLNVPATSSLELIFSIRKSAAADNMYYQILINGVAAMAERACIAGGALAGYGVIRAFIGPRATNYNATVIATVSSSDGTSTIETVHGTNGLTTTTGAITSLSIKARNGLGAMTVAVANVKVYEILGA